MIGLEGNIELGQIGEYDFLFPLGCFELFSVVLHFLLGAVEVVLAGVGGGVFGVVVEVLRASAVLDLVKLLGGFDVGLSGSPSFFVLQLDRGPLAYCKVRHY